MTTNATIRNMYCIGRNYRLHALELGNEVPESPMMFTKPSHAVVEMDGGEIQITANQGEVHFELEVVLRVGEAYKPGMPIDECFDAMTLGLDLTLRDVQSVLKKKGHPWLAAKGFKNSAPLGKWIPYPGEAAIAEGDFKLIRSGETAQHGFPKDMIFGITEIVRHIEENYGLGAGDLIFTGTPAGVAALRDGDVLEAYWGEEKLGSCRIAMK